MNAPGMPLKLSPNALRLLDCLSRADRSKPISIPELSQQSGMSIRTVQRYLRGLRAWSYLKIEQPRPGGPCLYILPGDKIRGA